MCESLGLPGDAVVENLPAHAGDTGSLSVWARKIPWRRKWLPSPVFLPGKSHGQRSLAGSSSWGCKESDMTEHTHAHITVTADLQLSCVTAFFSHCTEENRNHD